MTQDDYSELEDIQLELTDLVRRLENLDELSDQRRKEWIQPLEKVEGLISQALNDHDTEEESESDDEEDGSSSDETSTDE